MSCFYSHHDHLLQRFVVNALFLRGCGGRRDGNDRYSKLQRVEGACNEAFHALIMHGCLFFCNAQCMRDTRYDFMVDQLPLQSLRETRSNFSAAAPILARNSYRAHVGSMLLPLGHGYLLSTRDYLVKDYYGYLYDSICYGTRKVKRTGLISCRTVLIAREGRRKRFIFDERGICV